MTQQRISLEIKVGAFMVTGVALLVVFLFVIGDLSTYFQPGYTLRVIFDAANGISGGSPVQYAGVEVGKVEAVRIVQAEAGPPKVELLARLPRSIRVRADDVASISTFGLLGEKYLEIMPGPAEGPVLKGGHVLMGKPPVSTERIIERSNAVLAEFERTLEGLNSLVGDPHARVYLLEALQEARDGIRHWKILGERLNLILSGVEQGQGSLGKLVFKDDLHLELEAFVQDLRQHPWKLLTRPKQQKKPSAVSD